jgi:hypothetical protein
VESAARGRRGLAAGRSPGTRRFSKRGHIYTPGRRQRNGAQISEDDVVDWLQEVVGAETNLSSSRRWVETSQGYVYAPLVQPAQNLPNQPLAELPEGPLGRGMWAEVSQPYLDVTLNAPSASAPWLKNNPRPRLYYSQVF